MSERWDKLVWDDLIPHVEDDLRIGAFTIMEQFVRIGKRVVNLGLVTQAMCCTTLGASSTLAGVVMSFGESTLTIYATDEGYQDVLDWMGRQPSIRVIE